MKFSVLLYRMIDKPHVEGGYLTFRSCVFGKKAGKQRIKVFGTQGNCTNCF